MHHIAGLGDVELRHKILGGDGVYYLIPHVVLGKPSKTGYADIITVDALAGLFEQVVLHGPYSDIIQNLCYERLTEILRCGGAKYTTPVGHTITTGERTWRMGIMLTPGRSIPLHALLELANYVFSGGKGTVPFPRHQLPGSVTTCLKNLMLRRIGTGDIEVAFTHMRKPKKKP